MATTTIDQERARSSTMSTLVQELVQTSNDLRVQFRNEHLHRAHRVQKDTIQALTDHLGQYVQVLQELRHELMEVCRQRDIVSEDLAHMCETFDDQNVVGDATLEARTTPPPPSSAHKGAQVSLTSLRATITRLQACVQRQETELALCAKTQGLKYRAQEQLLQKRCKIAERRHVKLLTKNKALRQKVQALTARVNTSHGHATKPGLACKRQKCEDKIDFDIAWSDEVIEDEDQLQEDEVIVMHDRNPQARQVWKWYKGIIQTKEYDAVDRVYNAMCVTMRDVDWREFNGSIGLIQLVQHAREQMA